MSNKLEEPFNITNLKDKSSSINLQYRAQIRITPNVIRAIKFIIVLLTVLCLFIHFERQLIFSQYKSTFSNVTTTFKYEEQFFPSFDLRLDELNIIFKHTLVPYTHGHDYLPFFDGFISADSKKDSFLRLYNKDKYSFQISTNQVSNENIKCFRVEVENNFKEVSNGDVEMCVGLGNWSWFGGHESYNEPYWPINNQTFEYVPYVTGFPEIWATVLERYWLASAGLAIFIDDDIPLLVKHKENKLCFKSSRYDINKNFAYKSKFRIRLIANSLN